LKAMLGRGEEGGDTRRTEKGKITKPRGLGAEKAPNTVGRLNCVGFVAKSSRGTHRKEGSGRPRQK